MSNVVADVGLAGTVIERGHSMPTWVSVASNSQSGTGNEICTVSGEPT